MTHELNEERILVDSQVEALLDDLEMRCRTDVASVRDQTAVHRRTATTIRPGNASQRRGMAVTGETTEWRRQGVTCHTDAPIAVGDVFQLVFDREAVDLDALLAVCDRCTMLGEDRFESRFHFASEIVVPQPLEDRG